MWVAIVFFEDGLWPRVFMTSNFVEENAADINGTVISVAVVCCLIAFVRRVVRSPFCFEK